ncbi:hypothetical protein A8U91_00863 [Halomonas elongata]|uniref:Uncharacterized protein n=1 Tax=Halomonas elongata TaxID=2746 RepID=A0A1B8P2S3_HALEL|nr:hypothetical protein [Halomonas elongata]OBX36520.1 hypothetical protein A8U91_00863 [Halomonas elongata]
MAGSLPLYLKIQRHLLEKIHGGDWPPQYRIPPRNAWPRSSASAA